MPKKGKDRFRDENLRDDEYEASENTAREVSENLYRNAGIDPDTQHPGDYSASTGEQDLDSPPHSIGGVGGRPTPREFDNPWSPSEGTNAMGSKPKPDQESVASPFSGGAGGIDEGEVEDVVETETPQQIYAERMKADLEERGIHIDQLMSHAQGTEAAVRHAYLQQVENLRALQDHASEALDKLTHAGEASWEGMQGTVDDAFTSLRSAVGDAMKRMFGAEEESPEEPKEEC